MIKQVEKPRRSSSVGRAGQARLRAFAARDSRSLRPPGEQRQVRGSTQWSDNGYNGAERAVVPFSAAFSLSSGAWKLIPISISRVSRELRKLGYKNYFCRVPAPFQFFSTFLLGKRTKKHPHQNTKKPSTKGTTPPKPLLGISSKNRIKKHTKKIWLKLHNVVFTFHLQLLREKKKKAKKPQTCR